MSEVFAIGYTDDEIPGKRVITTVTFGQLVHDQNEGLIVNQLRPGVPGYPILARLVHEMLATEEGGAPLGPHNKVSAWDSWMPHVRGLHELAARGHLPYCEAGENLVHCAVIEIRRLHEWGWEPEFLGQFDSFAAWMDTGGQVLSNPTMICIDTFGRRCLNPADFLRASNDAAFPVRWFAAFKERPWARAPLRSAAPVAIVPDGNLPEIA